MKAQIITLAIVMLNLFVHAQSADGTMLVNEKQKKLVTNCGQSANKAWYSVYEKGTDTVLQKTFIVEKSKFSKVVDSLKKAEYSSKVRKQKVSDAVVTIKLMDFKFYRVDTVKKSSGYTLDSISVAKVIVSIKSEKEKLNKVRIYSQKYTSLNKSKTLEKIKKFGDHSLIKYAASEIFEFEIVFPKLFVLTPQSYFSSFESAEKEFF